MPAIESTAQITKAQRTFPVREAVIRWGKPCRVVVEQKEEKIPMLDLILGSSCRNRPPVKGGSV